LIGDVLSCQEGFFVEGYACKECAEGCGMCSGSGASECRQCRKGWFELDCGAGGDECTGDNGAKFMCVEGCPQGYYGDSATGKCLKCMSPCSACSSATACSDCEGNLFLHLNSSTCVLQCPENTYSTDERTCTNCAITGNALATGSQSCYRCDPNCKTCDSSASRCTSCQSSRFLFEGTCLDHCPQGTFAFEGRCKECAFGCSSCRSSSAQDCTSCKYGFEKGEASNTCHDCLTPSQEIVRTTLEPIRIETSHPYCNSVDLTREIGFGDQEVHIKIHFEAGAQLEKSSEHLAFLDSEGNEIRAYEDENTFQDFVIKASTFKLRFKTDSEGKRFGFAITAIPIKLDREEERCNEFAQLGNTIFDGLKTQIIETPHPYCPNMQIRRQYSFKNPSVRSIRVHFSPESQIEPIHDLLRLTNEFSEKEFANGILEDVVLRGNSFEFEFMTDRSESLYGFQMIITPLVTDFNPRITCAQFKAFTGANFSGIQPRALYSPHPYCNNLDTQQEYSFEDPRIIGIRVEFGALSKLESGQDFLKFSYGDNEREFRDGKLQNFEISGSNFQVLFHSDSAVTFYGFSATLTPILQDEQSIEDSDLDQMSCEDFLPSGEYVFANLKAQILESPHPYCNDMDVKQIYRFTDTRVRGLRVHFLPQSHLESKVDILKFRTEEGHGIQIFNKGTLQDFTISGGTFHLRFLTNHSQAEYGFITVLTPLIEDDIELGENPEKVSNESERSGEIEDSRSSSFLVCSSFILLALSAFF